MTCIKSHGYTYARLCPACSAQLGLDQELQRMFRKVMDDAAAGRLAVPSEPSINDPEHDAALAGLAELFGAKRRVAQ